MKYNKLFDLTDKVAVVTGSTKGIGKAIAEAMAAAGARVVISSRKEDACRRVAAEIADAGGETLPLPCNVSDKDQLQSLVDGTIGHWGRIDVLVCNAAVNPYFGPMAEIPDEAYDKTMDTNVKSALWLCNMAIPAMAGRGDGSVIVVSSIAGLKGHGKLGIYGLSKAANMQLVRNLAVEWGRHTCASTAWRRAWCAPTWRGRCGRTPTPTPRPSRPTPWAASANPRTSPAPRCSWPRRRRASSPATPWWSTAAPPS